MYKPDTVNLYIDYHNVQNECKTNINESISLFKIKPTKALFAKVDTMLTHIQIKMQLGGMPLFNTLCGHIFLVLKDLGVYMYAVNI